ncbi:predicted protein [Nematostella vectensis]|uniref:Peptidase S1 domain-containing protein n=1 Tax=Nematostella vectensis TaxID=45351 RepID=A7S1T0_NEMVE|nr:predicted protein [Nematostella vectensis]|eukprot:XP_001634483.1 predicted protein [Nematostella vectensis]
MLIRITSGSCGVSHHARIVGGTTAQQGGWPWQAQLRTSTGYPYCGGTLIHPEWVLTATHCLKGETASRVHIRLGAHRRTKGSGNEQDFRVIRLVTHPNYHRPVGYANDIALLKLDRPAKLDRYVNFACLPDQVPEPKEGDRCYITGWGKLSSHGSAPDILQQATVPVVGRARCMKAYRGQIHESMLCAGLDAGGVDACQGDSGGPMVCENAGRFYIQGATSWGNGCAAPGKFGVYARVKYVLDWIKSEMARP